VLRYLSRISGPILDRIDTHIEVVPVPFDNLSRMEHGEKSQVIRERVTKARKIQEQRFSGYRSIHCNAQMSSKLMNMFCRPDEAGLALLKNAMESSSCRPGHMTGY